MRNENFELGAPMTVATCSKLISTCFVLLAGSVCAYVDSVIIDVSLGFILHHMVDYICENS